jgi:glycerate kinase
LPSVVADADVVITGEGRFDAQSMAGKVPSYVISLGRPTMLVAGAVHASTDAFAGAVALVDLAGSVEAAIAAPLPALRTAGALLARGV